MPHFDENGIGTWICQLCAGIYNNLIKSTWMTPVPGKTFDGNVCPSCVSSYAETGITHEVAQRRATAVLANDKEHEAFYLSDDVNLGEHKNDVTVTVIKSDGETFATFTAAVNDIQMAFEVGRMMAKKIGGEYAIPGYSPTQGTDPRDPFFMYEDAPVFQDEKPSKEEQFIQSELKRLGIRNLPEPASCPDCSGDLAAKRGIAGGRVLVCLSHGIVWEDSEDAIRKTI